MHGSKTSGLDVHALATLRYIRSSMDAAGSVSIPGSAGIVMGFVGLAATALSLLPQFAAQWFYVWLFAAPIAALSGALLLTRSISPQSFVATGTPGRKLALGLLPSLFAGAVLTTVLWKADLSDAIPGTWLTLYGCALISASVSTLRIVARMGLCFTALGLVALLAPTALHVSLLGLGFGGLHLIFGTLIARGAHGRET